MIRKRSSCNGRSHEITGSGQGYHPERSGGFADLIAQPVWRGGRQAGRFTNVLAAGSQAGSANIASQAKAIRNAGTAAASAMGAIIGPVEEEEGYDKNFSAAVNIATALQDYLYHLVM